MQFKINRLKLFFGFNLVFGMSVSAYIRHQRMQRSAELLRTTSLPLKAVAEAVGYAHQGNFSAAFKAAFWGKPDAAPERAGSGGPVADLGG